MVVVAAVGVSVVPNGVFGTYSISPSTRSPRSVDEVVVVGEGAEVVVVEDEDGEGSLLVGMKERVGCLSPTADEVVTAELGSGKSGVTFLVDKHDGPDE